MRRVKSLAALLFAAWLAPGLASLVVASEAAAADAPAAPRPAKMSYSYDIFDNSVVRPATRSLDVALLARKLAHHPREAANVDADDEVRLPSTWWQPRMGYRTVTPDQVRQGPGDGSGPAPGRWTVTHAKTQGVTPGFQVKDARGGRFLVKFDPPGYPELSTGAEVIGSRLFWAAGYNVPDNTIAVFRVEDLDIAPGATRKDAGGREVPITTDYLRQLLSGVQRRPDGRYRCVASRLLEGKPIGPFRYEGRRADDPEDRIPHELRRELRGLWTVCAWVNHADSRGANSLDTWVSEGGRSFVRHNLIDFSAVLGAGRDGPRMYPTGSEYYADYGVMGRQAATLGLHPFAWEASVDPHMPAVGFVEAKTFDPARWRPDYPNPAFDERTVRDVRWGACIVGAFSDAHIRAAVDAAQYSDPRAADFVAQVLIGRRDKLAARWGVSVAPSPSPPPPMRASR